MEYLRTPDPFAAGLWTTPAGNGSNGSSVTPGASTAEQNGGAQLDRAGIKSSFQTLFSPSVSTTPAIFGRRQTVSGLTPFINGGTTPNLITPALGMLPGGPSPRVETGRQNGGMRGVPTPDMMRSPYLQAAAQEAVRREFLNMPSYISSADISAASEHAVPGSDFSSGQGQQRLVYAKDGAPVPPNTLSAYSKQDGNGNLQTPPIGRNSDVMGSGRAVSADPNAKDHMPSTNQKLNIKEYSPPKGDRGQSSDASKAAQESPESNQRVPNASSCLESNALSRSAEHSTGQTVPSLTGAQSQGQSQPQAIPQRLPYTQGPMTAYAVNPGQMQGQQGQQFTAYPSGRPPFGAIPGPPGMYMMGQPSVIMPPPHAPGAHLFTHPPGAVMMFAPPGAAPHPVMPPPPGMMMHSGHPGHIVHPSVAPVKTETVTERKERIEREKQDLIREFKKKTREAALVRFRQKRRERRFGKLIRYDCRKKLADARPRVKGRFVRIRSGDFDEDDEESEQAQVVPSLDV